MLRLLPEAHASVSRSVFLTAAMRSGTTMFQRLIDSLDGVDMFDEPWTAYALLPLIEEMDPDRFRYLLEAVLFEDCLVNALSGARVSVNPYHRSHIRLSKSDEEIIMRLESPISHGDAVARARKHLLGFKVTEMVPLVGRLRELYPAMAILVMVRRPQAVVASLLALRYYSDEQILQTPQKWPLKPRTDASIPFWVTDGDEETFLSMNETERCCASLVHQYEGLDPAVPTQVIDYDQLTASPKAEFRALTERMGWTWGSRTAELVAQITDPRKDAKLPKTKVRPDLWNRMMSAYEAAKKMADTGGS